MKEKVMAAERTKIYVNFFNKHSMRLIKKSKSGLVLIM